MDFLYKYTATFKLWEEMKICEKIFIYATGINQYNVIMFMLAGRFKVRYVKYR